MLTFADENVGVADLWYHTTIEFWLLAQQSEHRILV